MDKAARLKAVRKLTLSTDSNEAAFSFLTHWALQALEPPATAPWIAPGPLAQPGFSRGPSHTLLLCECCHPDLKGGIPPLKETTVSHVIEDIGFGGWAWGSSHCSISATL